MEPDEMSESDKLAAESPKLIAGLARGLGIIFGHIENQLPGHLRDELAGIITHARDYGDRMRKLAEDFVGATEVADTVEQEVESGLEPAAPAEPAPAEETPPVETAQEAPGAAPDVPEAVAPETPPTTPDAPEIEPAASTGETPPPLNVVDMVKWDGAAFLTDPKPDWLAAALMVGAATGGVALVENRFEVYRPDAEVQVGQPDEFVAILSDGTLTVASQKAADATLTPVANGVAATETAPPT